MNHTIVLRRFAADLQIAALRPQTQVKYLACVRDFLERSSVPAHRRTRDDVRSWLLHLIDDRHLAPSTYAVHLAALRFLFDHTVPRRLLLEHVPSPRRRPPRPARCLTRDELLRLFEAAPHPTARLLFQAAFGTGLRLGELCQLRGHHIDPERKTITVVDGKGGWSRVVLCGALLSDRLPFGTERRVFPVHPRTASRWFRRAAATAELPGHVRFHHLRASFASALAADGVSIAALMAALGHRRLATTARYVSSTFVDLGALHCPLDTLHDGP